MGCRVKSRAMYCAGAISWDVALFVIIREMTLGFFTDLHGQPLLKAFRSEAIVDRQIDELIGLIKGIMADGMVHQGEVEFLLAWMETNKATLDKWPAKAIYPRLVAALRDSRMDLEEEREIMDLLMGTVGGNTALLIGEVSNSTSLPYTKPAPVITFSESAFCFTGKFASGTRQWCEQRVSELGGVTQGNVTKSLKYLVIGEIGSRDWLHSTHGRKIEKAIELNEAGATIHVVGEQHWFEHLGGS